MGTLRDLVPKVELQTWGWSATGVTPQCDCRHTLSPLCRRPRRRPLIPGVAQACTLQPRIGIESYENVFRDPAACSQQTPSSQKCRANIEIHPVCLRSFAAVRMNRLAYTCPRAVDFARLLSRICSVVNPPPQTLHRQPGDAAWAIPGTGC